MPQLGQGFHCLSEVKGLISYPVKDSVTIVKGDALKDDGDGDAQLVTTAATATNFLGIAAEDMDNSGGGDGDLDVLIIPPREDYRFYVTCGTGTLVATDRGEFLAFKDANEVDRTAGAPTTGWALWVDELDETNNYAYGYFRLAG